jgi:ubiquinone/menaquinone biosynthesis C-methylase UbiE
MIFVYILIAAIIAFLVGLGLSRINLSRRPSFEAIEDKDEAAAYDCISVWPQFRLLRRMIIRRLSSYRPSGILADVGCGPGRLIALIAHRFPQIKIIGIDAAQEMIETARRGAVAAGILNRAEFRVGDVGHLPMDKDSIDFAVSTLSLHHWSNPSLGLAEIYRVLKPGGQLLLFDLRRDSRRFFYWLMRFAQAVVVPFALRNINEPLGSLLASYSVSELKDLLRQTAFREWRIAEGTAWVYAWARK